MRMITDHVLWEVTSAAVGGVYEVEVKGLPYVRGVEAEGSCCAFVRWRWRACLRWKVCCALMAWRWWAHWRRRVFYGFWLNLSLFQACCTSRSWCCCCPCHSVSLPSLLHQIKWPSPCYAVRCKLIKYNRMDCSLGAKSLNSSFGYSMNGESWQLLPSLAAKSPSSWSLRFL